MSNSLSCCCHPLLIVWFLQYLLWEVSIEHQDLWQFCQNYFYLQCPIYKKTDYQSLIANRKLYLPRIDKYFALKVAWLDCCEKFFTFFYCHFGFSFFCIHDNFSWFLLYFGSEWVLLNYWSIINPINSHFQWHTFLFFLCLGEFEQSLQEVQTSTADEKCICRVFYWCQQLPYKYQTSCHISKNYIV